MRSAPMFRAAENNHGIVVHLFEQRAQQIGFLVVGHWVDDVLDGFGRRAARADLNGLRIAASPI